jgi:hypothetical protein
MPRVEYRIERIPLDRDEPRLFQLLERLAELGRQGWHVAAADLTPHPSEGRVTVLLERELGDPVPAGGDHPPPVQDPNGTSDWIIGSAAIRYGHAEMSKKKRDKVLKAELPHLWPHIQKLVRGKTEYSDKALRRVLGTKGDGVVDDLVNIGLLTPNRSRDGSTWYKIPFLYRDGLELTQGRVD